MPTRITVRYLGSEVGKKVARPDTKKELLELAAKKLNLSTPASRIFAEGGDEYDADEDVVLIESDEIIYVSCGEDFGSTASINRRLRPGRRPPRLLLLLQLQLLLLRLSPQSCRSKP